ncbi:MAG: S41 family peptidase [Planctomycetes bacterium]|nr:S41 family peptidase [Planctomycetota bacterium]
MIKRLAWTSSLLATVAIAALALASSAQDGGGKIVQILDRIEESKGATLWEDIRELEEIGQGALAEARKGLTRADANVRVAVGALLYRLQQRDEGLEALTKVFQDSKTPAARRVAAQATAMLFESDAQLTPVQKRTHYDRLVSQASSAKDEMVAVLLHRGAYALTESIVPRRAVRDLFDKTTHRQVKDEAALALAQMNTFQAIKTHLKEMAQRPGEQGRLARAYLEVNKLMESLNRVPDSKEGKDDKDSKYRVLDEIIDKLHAHYHDPSKIEDDGLIDAAARGMLSSLDPYTAYYDEKMIDQLRQEELEGHYGGIGARVSMRRDKGGVTWLTITEPIFSGPAYRSGLRSNDTIVEVEGDPTANKDLSELVRKLRGKPGTPVAIKVARRGWTKPREFKIVREEVQLDITTSQLLPGRIGYLNYATFGDLDDELKLKGANLETHLKTLRDRGMKALILDLRGNSGGYLRTARRIASLFLDRGQLILKTRARGKEVERYVAEEPNLKIKLPMVVLVDGTSASASEILAGCLQDHKRAIVVGEQTFGKGSVQDLKMMESTGGRSAARITIAKWYLPSDRSVEKEVASDGKVTVEGGVAPDVKVSVPERDFWKEWEFERLRAEGKIEEYVRKNFTAHRETFEALAEMDYGDPSRYPEFDKLYESLDTKASKDEVRELLRDFVRMRVQDERKKAFAMDYQTDVQLQRAILEACKLADIEPSQFQEYGVFAAANSK